jgi:hypothetical protein
VNQASSELLRALIPELGEEEAQRVVKRRTDDTQGGAFKSADDFWSFLQTMGDFAQAKSRLAQQGITILGQETSYRVTVTAKSGSATRTWTAEVGPLPPQVDQTATSNPNPVAPTSPINTQTPTGTSPNPAGDSNSLNIIYLKAD